jgi:hypothetical protein
MSTSTNRAKGPTGKNVEEEKGKHLSSEVIVIFVVRRRNSVPGPNLTSKSAILLEEYRLESAPFH